MSDTSQKRKRRGQHGKGRTQTRIAHRFRSRYTDASLYVLVARAARALRPVAPEKLRQVEFDRHRAQLGAADAPSARQIASRLGRPWADIVADAISDNPDQQKRDSALTKAEEADWLTLRHVVYALRRVALFLGQDVMTRDEYALARAKLIVEDRRRHRYGGLAEENLPTPNQIEWFTRDLTTTHNSTEKLTPWQKACVEAGLRASIKRETGGMEVGMVIHHFIEAASGYLPRNRADLRRFTRVANLRMRTAGDVTEQTLADAAIYRESLHLPMPDEVMPKGMQMTFWLPLGEIPDALPAITARSKEGKLAAIAEFLDECDERGIKPTQKNYKTLRKSYDWPSDSHLGEGMGYSQWIKAADQWRRDQDAIRADVQPLAVPAAAEHHHGDEAADHAIDAAAAADQPEETEEIPF